MTNSVDISSVNQNEMFAISHGQPKDDDQALENIDDDD